jgi:MoaA/NifB/PqqE/SkfB family radical SAM enzyme
MKAKGIDYTCFEVSSKCNMACRFCFSDWRQVEEQLPVADAVKVIDELADRGLRAINLTGGDPLLHEGIIDLCKHCQSRNLMTILSTTGIELLEKEEALLYVDAINLPLDSSEASVHNAMRPCKIDDHHGLVLCLVDYLNREYPHIKIKVNTMVGRSNLHAVAGIGKLLGDKVFSWKLSKFLPSGYGARFASEFAISDEEYQAVLAECVAACPNSNIIGQDFHVSESAPLGMFIDGRGRIQVHTAEGIQDHGDISHLDEVFQQFAMQGLRKSYFNKAYERGANES